MVDYDEWVRNEKRKFIQEIAGGDIQRLLEIARKRIFVNPCKVKDCGKTDDQKPMAFRGEDWCSDKHRKLIEGDHTPQRRW